MCLGDVRLDHCTRHLLPELREGQYSCRQIVSKTHKSNYKTDETKQKKTDAQTQESGQRTFEVVHGDSTKRCRRSWGLKS